jgi:hypothetical protein
MFSEKAVSLSNAGLVGREPTRGHGIPTGVKRRKTELHADNVVWLDGRKQGDKAWGETKDTSLINQKGG